MSKPIGKQALFSMVSAQAKPIVQKLIELTKSKNENIALGACKVLINKILPDLKAEEKVIADEDKKFDIRIVNEPYPGDEN